MFLYFCNKIGFLYNFVRRITKGFKFMVHRLTGLTKLLIIVDLKKFV